MKAFLYLFLSAIFSLFLIAYLRTDSIKYVGTVISVNSYSGNATIKTKSSITYIDTLITVTHNNFEHFVEGQVITVWTGGELLPGIASTKPQ